MLTCGGPGNHCGTARQVDSHFLIQEPPPPADGDGGAGPRAASQSLTRSALEDPQSNMAAINDLHEPHIGAFRKTRVMLDTRPKPRDRRGFRLENGRDHVRTP